MAIATWSATAAMNSMSEVLNTRSTTVPTVITPTVRPRTRSSARIAFHSALETRSTWDSDRPTADADALTWGPTWRLKSSTWSGSRPTVWASLYEDLSRSHI